MIPFILTMWYVNPSNVKSCIDFISGTFILTMWYVNSTPVTLTVPEA